MYVVIGLAVVLGSVILGYTLHHGNLGVLMQGSEFVIIGGAALGAMLIGNPPSMLGKIGRKCIALTKGDPFTQSAYSELLLLLFELFNLARKDGLLALEQHIERPPESLIFQRYPFFMANHHAVDLLTDTIKVLLSGSVDQFALSEILELDLERHHEEAMEVSSVLARTGDAMPGFGIVAAVLGVVITMGSIGGAASEVGRKVAGALVGTFLGVLLAYGVFNPLAAACERFVKTEDEYLQCIKTALLAFARGDVPLTAVEFARRNIEPELRPSFSEMEELIRTVKS